MSLHQTSRESTSDSELAILKKPSIAVAVVGRGGFPKPSHVVLPEKSEKPLSKPPLLCLGMARTGTASLCAALNTLGMDRIHHDFKIVKEDWQWELFERAADATFPVLKTYTDQPFTRADWDELFRSYDVGTDIISFFAMSLIDAYPDAQVILVERDIERWHKSVRLLFEPWTHWSNRVLMRILGRLAGTKTGIATYKFSMGWTESTKPKDIMANARAAYVKHYEGIRAAVPPKQLLEYRLADGWEPLAAFLGKPPPAPDVKFPRINDAADFKQHRWFYEKYFLKRALNKICRGFWRRSLDGVCEQVKHGIPYTRVADHAAWENGSHIVSA
ncbi:hypothetical protein LMH87_004081 [Akanthomyces muscarius]|uniref:NAD dependent epimerase/dehydratase n=1 Tax=Akanthomyces muscarius TaxID=2231603 RepID=A0A9W8Q4J6_AKAMU|nr:hypothetical protein LMH87_004081 [Akanthomyces muscarius]KAJ4145226.1 hypothetical protein LMH87_004081 [Akanthomyces muscarius]